jgi:hypothetical protein
MALSVSSCVRGRRAGDLRERERGLEEEEEWVWVEEGRTTRG